MLAPSLIKHLTPSSEPALIATRIVRLGTSGYFEQKLDFSTKLVKPVKSFTVSMVKQLAIYLLIYMKRMKEHENFKIDKFECMFGERQDEEVGLGADEP
jgi:hypothetical protein